jgi:hypothetical protein
MGSTHASIGERRPGRWHGRRNQTQSGRNELDPGEGKSTMTRNFFAASERLRSPRPHDGGVLPRFAASVFLAGLFGPLLCASFAGCAGGSADQVTAPLPLGMSSSIAPYYSDGNLSIYQAARPVTLPVRKPTSAESKALGPAPSGTPYTHAPFLRADDESVEIHYTVSNLDADPHTIWILIDPWNEFVRYVPGVTVVDADVTVPNFGYDLSFYVPGKSRLEGTITPDDVGEIARKLAAAENVIGQAATIDAAAQANGSPSVTDLVNHIFNPQNRSNSNDPLYTPYIPPVVAGLTGFDLGIRTFEPGNVAVEITMDVQDLNGNRFFAPDDTTTKPMGEPNATLSPPAARF